MEKELTHASESFRIKKCPGSRKLIRESGNYGHVTEDSDVGDLIHELLYGFIKGDDQKDQVEALEPYSKSLFFNGVKVWKKVEDAFFDPKLEQTIVIGNDTGTLDVHDCFDKNQGEEVLPELRVIVLDWKSGNKEDYHWDQILTYLTLVMANYECYNPTEIIGIIGWLKDGQYEIKYFSLNQILKHGKEMQAAKESDELNTGIQCLFCPMPPNCPAFRKHLSIDVDNLGLTIHDQTKIIQQFDFYKSAKKQIDKFNSILKILLQKNGELNNQEFRLFRKVLRERKKINNTLNAYNELIKEFSSEELISCMEFKVSKLIDLVCSKSEENKNDAIDSFLEKYSEFITISQDISTQKERTIQNGD